MKKIICISLALTFSLSGCKKQQLEKFEGTYSNSEYNCNPSVTLSRCEENRICFDFTFGCNYIKNLKCDFSSSKELIIEPISSIGVMSQGGYELFGGIVKRDDNKLTIEIDFIKYCDPSDPPFIICTAKRKTETYIYSKN